MLRRLERDKQAASQENKAVLVKYVGWGGLPQAFDAGNREWRKEHGELAELLTEEEYRGARASTLNAHYTSPVIIRAMYEALRRFGFEQGRILEPACGIGHFIGLMPDDIHRHSIVTGVEIDPLTSRIAKALYPDADIRQQPFEEARIANGYYDAAISNIPFGDYQPFDPRFNDFKFPIHDYFFAAGLEKLRPGGLLLFITSIGTMDKANSTLREYLSQRAELLGAIRLPNDAFKQNANTEVTTDILMLRKPKPGEQRPDISWIDTADHINSAGETIRINKYFSQRPGMMLGEMRLAGRMYQRNEPTLERCGRDLAASLTEAIRRLPERVYQTQKHTTVETVKRRVIPAPQHVKANAYIIVEGQIAIRDGDNLKLLTDVPSQTRQRIRGLIQIRDAVRESLRTQMENSPEEAVIEARQALNRVYDSFVYRKPARRPKQPSFASERSNTNSQSNPSRPRRKPCWSP